MTDVADDLGPVNERWVAFRDGTLIHGFFKEPSKGLGVTSMDQTSDKRVWQLWHVCR